MCPAPAGRLRRYRSFLTIGRTRRGISPFPLHHKKTAHWGRFLYGGEGGIRTLDTGLGYTPLAGELRQPLGHLAEILSALARLNFTCRAFNTVFFYAVLSTLFAMRQSTGAA